MTIIAAILLLLALAGTGYMLLAAWLVVRFGARPVPPRVAAEPVTLLKPLHGAEPRLRDNLATFLDQDWAGPIEMVCGVQRADDPAIGVVNMLATSSPPFVRSEVEVRASGVPFAARTSTTLGTNGEGEVRSGSEQPGRRVRLIVDSTPHGANAKIANLVNMMHAISPPPTPSEGMHAISPAFVPSEGMHAISLPSAPSEGMRTTSPPFVPSVVEVRAVSATFAARPSTTLGTHGEGGQARTTSHDLIILSDSDMAAPPDYLATLAATLATPGVGAATCAYRGRGDAGRWSVLAAAGISYHFLPQLVVGLALGLARPGMGSTIALRRATLDAIGGFAPFADALADDYALAEAVRALGLRVEVPPMLLIHGCAERSIGEVWRHERRWAATILQINPAGQLGTIVTHPLPMALLCLPLAPRLAGVAILLALASRLLLKRAVDRASGASSAPAWLLPLRDCLSFAVFVSAFFVRSVDWRGARLRMERGGRIVPQRSREPS